MRHVDKSVRWFTVVDGFVSHVHASWITYISRVLFTSPRAGSRRQVAKCTKHGNLTVLTSPFWNIHHTIVFLFRGCQVPKIWAIIIRSSVVDGDSLCMVFEIIPLLNLTSGAPSWVCWTPRLCLWGSRLWLWGWISDWGSKIKPKSNDAWLENETESHLTAGAVTTTVQLAHMRG